MRSIHAGFLLLLSFALLHACIAQPEREQVSPLIRITLHPESDAVRVAYALPGPVSSFRFRNSAGDIRTDTWQTGEGMLGRTEITFPAPVDAFTIEMSPDLKDRDRIYPGLVRVGEGWLVYPRHLMPLDDNLAFEIAYALPDGWVVLGHRDASGRMSPDGWKYFGPETQVERGAAIVATDPATPAWLRQEIVAAANETAALFTDRLGVSLPSPATIIISFMPDMLSSGMRGDVTPGAMMSVRFTGPNWAERDEKAALSVHEFLAHEIFHFWNGGLADSADNAARPWLHEGGASYAAMLAAAAKQGRLPGSADFLATLNGHFSACQRALGADDSLLTAKMNAGNAPYACGVILQWAWDAGLRATSDGASDVLTLWRDMLADAAANDGKYSVASAQRLAPPAAAGGADILLNASGETRWPDFAEAMMDYGAALSVGRDGASDRAEALMHLLKQHCQGQYGFLDHDRVMRLDTGDRCGPLNGDSEVDTIAGLPFNDAEAIRDRLHALCASDGLVEFGWKGRTVAAAPCTAELPPAKHVWKIVRAFGS